MNLKYVKDHLNSNYKLRSSNKLRLTDIIEPQKTMLEVHCKNHGIDFTTTWRNIRNGHGCFICDGGTSVKMIVGRELESLTGRPIEYAGDTSDLKARVLHGSPIPIICMVCGHGDVDNGQENWKRPISQLKTSASNGGHGCPKCYHGRSSKEKQLSPDGFQKRLSKKFGNAYKFDKSRYEGINKKCLFTHTVDNCGQQFEMRGTHILNSEFTPCPACGGGKILDKCETDEQLNSVIIKRSQGNYRLAKRGKSSYSIRCNRCDDTKSYERQLSLMDRLEFCKTCLSNKPYEGKAFKEHEAITLLERRGLRAHKKKPLSSYKIPYDFYDIKTGKKKISDTSIFELLKSENKRRHIFDRRDSSEFKRGASWTEDEKQLLLGYAKAGYTNGEIASLLHRTRGSIDGCIFKLRKKGYKVENENTKNESYFSIPSIENCYIAGLIASDGWIARNGVSITLKAIDELVLKNICTKAQILQPNGELKKLSYSTSKEYDGIYVTLRAGKAEQWIKDLERIFSITKNKSNTIKPPSKNLTKKQVLAYIGGLIEGDGSVKKERLISWCSNSDELTDWFCHVIEGITRSAPNRSQNEINPDGTGGLHSVYLSKYPSNILYEKIANLRVTTMDRKWSRMSG